MSHNTNSTLKFNLLWLTTFLDVKFYILHFIFIVLEDLSKQLVISENLIRTNHQIGVNANKNANILS